MLLRRVVDEELAVLLELRVKRQPQQTIFIRAILIRHPLADVQHFACFFDVQIVCEDEHAAELRDHGDSIRAIRRESESDRALNREIRKRVCECRRRRFVIDANRLGPESVSKPNVSR